MSNSELPSLLLVDDDATFRAVLTRALEKRGYAVTAAESVEQALPLAAANPPEYAVLDLKMEGASGLVLVQRLLAPLALVLRLVLALWPRVLTSVLALMRQYTTS